MVKNRPHPLQIQKTLPSRRPMLRIANVNIFCRRRSKLSKQTAPAKLPSKLRTRVNNYARFYWPTRKLRRSKRNNPRYCRSKRSFWLPHLEADFQDKQTKALNTSALGVLDKNNDSIVTEGGARASLLVKYKTRALALFC